MTSNKNPLMIPEILGPILRHVIRDCGADAPISIAMAPRQVCRLWKSVFDDVNDVALGKIVTFYDEVQHAPPGKFRVKLLDPTPAIIGMVGKDRSEIIGQMQYSNVLKYPISLYC